MASGFCKLQPPPGMARTHAIRSAKSLAPKASDPITMVSAPALRSPGTVCSRMPPSAASTTRRAGAFCGNERVRFAQPRLGLGVEVLAFDADARAEQRQHADAVEERCGGRNRRMQLQHDAGFQPLRRDQLQGCGSIGVLGVHADQVGAGIGELLDLALQDRVGHHEMDVQRLCRGAARDRDEVGEEQQCRREMAVGHVDVENVGERLDTRDVVGQAAEVGRPQRHLGEQPVFGQSIEPIGGGRSERVVTMKILSSWRCRRGTPTARRGTRRRSAPLSVALGVISTSCAPGIVAASVCA